MFWNVQYSEKALLSYQYRQRIPNERGCQYKIMNLAGKRIDSCRTVCPNSVPIGPLLPYSCKCEIDKLFQCYIRCKHAHVFGRLAELAVIVFNGICSIYYLSG